MAPADPDVDIRLLGRFAVSRRGVELADRDVGSRKARTLLKLLLVERPAFVASDRIADVLWGDDPPTRPDDNVATLVSRLRARFGPDAVAGGRGAYAIPATMPWRVDLDEATRLTAEAEARIGAEQPALAATAAGQALSILGPGNLLEEEGDAPWVEPARRDVASLLRRARRAAWTAAIELGERDAALAAAGAAVADDALDEEAHRAVMRAHWRSHEPGEALAAYQRLRETLVDQLGADPGPATETLYLAILRKEPDPGEATGPPRRFAGPDPPPAAGPARPKFVGRDIEMEVLAGAWSAAVAGHPGMVMVTGEAGIGKTRLVLQLADLVRDTGGRAVHTRCYEAERSLFLQPLVELIRTAAATMSSATVRDAAGDWAGTLAELVPELREVAPVTSYDRGPAEVEHRRAFEAVTWFLRRLGEHQPTLVVVDDAHLAGDSTVQLLHFLAHRLGAERLLVAMTVRSDEGAGLLASLGDSGRRLDIGPLPTTAVAELAASMGIPECAAAVARQTRGHTLFAVEALRVLAAGSAGTPETLRAAVLARVRRAGADVERLLRAAVVIGAAFDLDLAAALLDLPLSSVTDHAGRALDAGLIVDAGAEYEFANDLIREVLYQTTPGPARVAHHRRLVRLLAGRPEAVAAHATAASDWATAVEAWLEAARQASAQFANRDAELLATAALEAAGHRGDAARAAVHLTRGRIREDLGDYAGAHEDHSAALELSVASADEELEAAALERLGWTAYYARGVLPPDVLVARALDYGERAAAARHARPSAVVLLGRLRHAQGDVDGASAAYDTAGQAKLDPSTAALLESCRGLLAVHTDRFDEARRLADQATEDARRAGLFRTMVTSVFESGLACANLGDLAGALARFDRMGSFVAEFDDPLYRSRHTTVMSWVWRELGDLARAGDLIAESVERIAAAGALVSHPGQHAVLGQAECKVLEGDEHGAAELLASLEGHLDLPLSFHWRSELRWLELWTRIEPARAEALLDLARRRHSPKYEALALARLGRHEDAAHLATSVGSSLLLAEVAPAQQAHAAAERMAAALPDALRARFLERGRVVSALARRSG